MNVCSDFSCYVITVFGLQVYVEGFGIFLIFSLMPLYILLHQFVLYLIPCFLSSY